MNKTFRNLFATLVLFCLLLTSCSSSNTDDTKNQKTAQSIEELQKRLEIILQDTNTPGMSVAIVNKEGPEWVAGLGKTDVANNRAATANTLFRIGSVSKAFASLAALKLADEGKLSLQDPLRKLAPEVWFENRWEATHPVRIVNLLEHTTGWDDASMREYAYDAPDISLADAFEYDHNTRISRWPPSTRMAYCNSGPAVAAYIVEKITGVKFEDYVDQNFFQPIGMRTATYFLPPAEKTTLLYHPDGKTPYQYWNFMYRPTGAINASANDMANYLLFYLNKGNVNGKQIIKAADVERMESPTSTWAAEEGLKAGYGLGNFWTIHDGFAYHGHDGGVIGGVTVMEYLPQEGIGYFFSINSDSFEAREKAGKAIRAYITRNLEKPTVPNAIPLSQKAAEYTGWYRPDSPRVKLAYFLERLFLAYVDFKKDSLRISSIGEIGATYLPVVDSQFRYVSKTDSPDPVATVKLLEPKTEGKFIQTGVGMVTKKRIPSWQAITEIATTAFFLLSVASLLIYAPFWILGGLNKNRRRPAERSMKAWPLIAALSLGAFVFTLTIAKDDFIFGLGNMTGLSISLFLTTIVFAAASALSTIALWKAPKEGVRNSVRIYSTIVTIALVIGAIYLAYWGIIGLRTWV